MLGYIVWLISFKVADAVVGRDGLGILSRFNLQFTFIKNVYISICFILKILTDFRKTVETGMDPRLNIFLKSDKFEIPDLRRINYIPRFLPK